MRTYVILGVVFIALIAVVLWWKNSGKETVKEEAKKLAPEIQLSKLSITDIDDKRIKMISETVIQNKLPAEIVIDSLDYEVFIDSVRVIQSIYPKRITLKESDSATIKLPLELDAKQMKSLIARFQKRNTDSADYTVKASFQIKVPVAGQRDFDIEVTKKLPAMRGIKVRPVDFDIERFGFKESKVEMAVEVENRNAFPVGLKNGKYSVSIEKDFEADGSLEKIIHIPAKSKETVSMQMNVRTAKVPKLGWKILFKEKKTNFDIKFSGTLMSENEMMSDSKMQMHAEGTLDEIKELVKK